MVNDPAALATAGAHAPMGANAAPPGPPTGPSRTNLPLTVLLALGAAAAGVIIVLSYIQIARTDRLYGGLAALVPNSPRVIEARQQLEDLTLVIFAALLAMTFCGLLVFFKGLKLHHRKTVPRLIAGNAVVLLFLASFAPLGGEIYFRWFYDETDSFGLMKVSQRWFERHYIRNRNGFRDSMKEYVAKPPKGTTRVTFVGDSFTAGHGVDDVEARFANIYRKQRPELEVHVLAECGWETSHALANLRLQESQEYETDLLVLVYCLNDIADLIPGKDEFYARVYRARPPLLCRHSFFLNTMYYWLYISADPDLTNYYHMVPDHYAGATFDRQANQFRELQAQAERFGAKLVVVTFPMLHALGEDYPFRRVHERLNEYWKEQGVPHLDLLPTFIDHSPRELVVNSRDAHPNERAHAIAAEVIGQFLDEQLRLMARGASAARQSAQTAP